MLSDEFRSVLETCDTAKAMLMWRTLAPHLPQPMSHESALFSIHHARTQANSIRFRLRAYSHRWLTERGLPSGLPDYLRPRAERMYPVIVEAVGIAVVSKIPIVANGIRQAMSDAVSEAYADGRRDPEFVRQRMMEARERKRRYFRELLSVG